MRPAGKVVTVGFVGIDEKGRMVLSWTGNDERKHMQWEDQLHDQLDNSTVGLGENIPDNEFSGLAVGEMSR